MITECPSTGWLLTREHFLYDSSFRSQVINAMNVLTVLSSRRSSLTIKTEVYLQRHLIAAAHELWRKDIGACAAG